MHRPGRYKHQGAFPDWSMIEVMHLFAGSSGLRLPFRVHDRRVRVIHFPGTSADKWHIPNTFSSFAKSRELLWVVSLPQPAMHSVDCRRFGDALTMCDWVLPWCFLANSAFASPLPRADFKCAGNALFNEEAIVRCVGRGVMENEEQRASL